MTLQKRWGRLQEKLWMIDRLGGVESYRRGSFAGREGRGESDESETGCFKGPVLPYGEVVKRNIKEWGFRGNQG